MKNPKYFLETNKIYFSTSDEINFEKYKSWINNRSTIEFLETGHYPRSESELKNYIEEINQSNHSVIFSVLEKDTKKYVGNAKIGPIDWINRRAEFGRMIGEVSARGKGYGKDITALLMKYAFEILNLNKLTAGAISNNISSIKSNQKLGLKIEGEFKEHVYNSGKYIDVVRMGITKKEYLKENKIDN